MDQQKTISYIDSLWTNSIIPTLMDYIKIPNKSPLFDPDWQANGYMNQAVNLITDWCKEQTIDGMQLDIIQLEHRTPIIFIEIPGQSDETVLLYGHLDKQPEMTGWDSDLAPFKPVLKNEKLYGRGAADDGYAAFASLAAIKSLHEQKIPHARCIILIEACEESGSYDLPYYIEALKQRIGNPTLIICLDSGCGNYNQLWVSTSLRGVIGGILYIDVLHEGVHSGNGSGIVPNCFMILRQLLNRIEDETTGQIKLDKLYVEIPKERLSQAANTARILGDEIYQAFPFYKGTQPLTSNVTEQIISRTWRPALSVIGCDGLPPTHSAGNVTLPKVACKLSIRIPPTANSTEALALIKDTLEANPPFGAQIHFDVKEAADGWNAPTENPWLTDALNKASTYYFGQAAQYMGEGGSIPFMGMLGKQFPDAQFLITGVLGPGSNAHGPNEFLHIPTGKKLTCCIAEVIAKQFNQNA